MHKSHLRLTDTGERDENGLRILALDGYDRSGIISKTWYVNSGQPDHQDCLAYLDPDSYSGDQRPIPEDVYDIGKLDFAGGKFDWVGGESGIGDFWAPIMRALGDIKRKAFGFHWDENRKRSPGSLGCVVFATKKMVEEFVIWMRQHDPDQLVVDWSLGTLPAKWIVINKPATKPVKLLTKQPAVEPSKPSMKDGSSDMASVMLDGKKVEDVPIVDNRTMVTVSLMAALMGLEAPEWDAKTRTVSIKTK
jgi:hypothetical protein